MSSTKPSENAYQLAASLPANCLSITAETHRTRYNGELPEVDRLYLHLTGTPESFRYLAKLLLELASNANASVILDPADLTFLELSNWSAIDVSCRDELSKSNPVIP